MTSKAHPKGPPPGPAARSRWLSGYGAIALLLVIVCVAAIVRVGLQDATSSEEQTTTPDPVSQAQAEEEHATAKPTDKPPTNERPPSQEPATSPEPVTRTTESRSPEQLRINLNVREMPLRDILDAIHRQTRTNFLLEPGLGQKPFTVFLENVTVSEALRALLEAHGMGYERYGTGNTFVIKAIEETERRLTARVFHMRYAQLADLGNGPGAGAEGGAQPSAGQGAAAAPGGSSDSNFVKVIRSALTEHGRLEIYPETNSLVITDVPENFPAIEELIQLLDTAIPQILIEAYIVEVSETAVKKLGLEFGGSEGVLGKATGPARLLNYPTHENRALYPGEHELRTGTSSIKDNTLFGGNKDYGIFYGLLSFQDLTATLKAIETRTDGKFLARPKILTLNNRAAEIAVTANTAVGKKTSSQATTAQVTASAERQKTGVILKVTPQVNEGDLVTLLIEPTVSRPATSEFFPNDFVDAKTRSVRTSVRVRDGSTLYLGGLISDDETKTTRKVPLLGDVPLLGRLFTFEDFKAPKVELLIFITPRVVKEL